MAKRKAARRSGRGAGQARKKTGGRKAAGRARTAARKTARKSAKKARKAPASAARRASSRSSAGKRKTASAKQAKPSRAASAKVSAKRTRKVVVRPAAASGSRRAAIPVRKAPGLDRERRVIRDEDELISSSPPSSLDLDRSASAVRTGRQVLKDRYAEHTETSPALTGGDVDADWESAYSVGDEAPGGDNPTPDQDIVDDIGRAVGVEYQDNEELKGEEKIAKRDRNRWELDPASSDDWDDR